MADDKKNRGPADRARINVHEDYEVRYWCEKFGCTRAELVEAVNAAGVMANMVENYLKQKKR
ncbi:DUF3606 domain-containing protein [Bradyrhizobium diazoefficiens]|uniref:DUF3606 domain-containing protein n=1 Tax=Bradyrhizobium diazoefficiens TaxID=1355477 RepID=UPI000BE9AA08|nr:DUF3606 domain-containing protein [Bradyrhizobium diazoefficiens]PDT58705.1 DUF3606 domain-containing protein [Bradyrhizobium diazoefficiens]QLD43851.1 DUF3606 domain-containing protein [Bradyrhizobium diazoefficiens]